jgi:hypothetical protein
VEVTFPCTAGLEPVFVLADFLKLLAQFYRSSLYCYLCVSRNFVVVVIPFYLDSIFTGSMKK